MRKKITILLMVITMLLCSILPEIPVWATTKQIATLTGDLNVRKEPSISADIVATVKKGESYEILDEAQDDRTPPVTWYQIEKNGVTGWISSTYVTVSEEKTEEETVQPEYDLTTDEGFELYLEAQGFPEDYKESLRELHKNYPNWIFEAQHVEYTWEEVLEAQTQLGKNLVPSSSVKSWKSTQTGAYNWEKGTWTVFDSGGWVQASEEIVAYYLDPRNFLDENYIFQFLKQSYDAESMTEEEISAKKSSLKTMVADTFLAGKYVDTTTSTKKISYVTTLMTAAENSGVDPLMLASMILQEQGTTGSGKSISGTVSGYEDYYNYFNIGAYSTSSMTAVQRGLWYASGSGTGQTSYERPWNTRTKAIIGGSKYYGASYVNVGQDTMYLKKFNVQGSNAFSHQFMTNVAGGAAEGKHVSEGYDQSARETALVFKIPVYKDMPSKVSAKPTSDKDPNYMLKSLSVTDCTLTPTFDIYETSYAATVTNEIMEVEISAAAVSSTTKISGIGKKTLKVGENKFVVKTTAENGDTREYEIRIVRKKSTGAVQPVTISSNIYSLNEDKTLTGISEIPTSVEEFAANLNVENGYVKVLDSEGNDAEGNICTGMKVKVYNVEDKCKYTYDVVIYGDANGDGVINAKDLLVIQKNNIKVKELTDVYLIAADVNRDDVVNAKDLLLVQKNNIKIKLIDQ